MSYHKDDGSTVSGFICTILVIASFFAGYAIRDYGVKFNIDIPQQKGVKLK